MNKYLTLAVIFLVTLLAGQANADPAPVNILSKLSRQRRDAARKTYDALWANYRDRRASAEILYLWSIRWLEAEKPLGEEPADQIAACTSHLERMAELERLVSKVQRTGQTTIDEVSAAEFYRVEAEVWLLQAKDKKLR